MSKTKDKETILTLLELLKEASDVLSDHCFSEDGEYTNEDTLAFSQKLDKFLEPF